jgi:hypothetical protein
MTNIQLLRYNGNLSISHRDEELLRNDLLKILVTYVCREPATFGSASYLDLVVQSTCLRGARPRLHVSWAGLPAPVEVSADRPSGTRVLLGSTAVYDGGLYGGDHPHPIIRELGNQPGASVLVLLSQRPLQILGTEEAGRFDCCEVMCVGSEEEGTTVYRLKFYCGPHIGKFDDLVSSSDSTLQQRNTNQYGWV